MEYCHILVRVLFKDNLDFDEKYKHFKLNYYDDGRYRTLFKEPREIINAHRILKDWSVDVKLEVCDIEGKTSEICISSHAVLGLMYLEDTDGGEE